MKNDSHVRTIGLKSAVNLKYCEIEKLWYNLRDYNFDEIEEMLFISLVNSACSEFRFVSN